ncbi:hypothetical protein D5R40_29265 [Okeania hirsuta]|uniref:Uncharacterized protein n=1 Tax=Okeania hirsuta TaxID=1458930 RepID=A0A3N6PGW2_9CYAN|nr:MULTISPECIES: hypothetical protein [Okeania]NET79968.1 hypothetical protein [Okeania sp. SIO1F9]RQH25693.1 hypothetical protein D5R40_29265 [Okeania hirsuta]
MDSLSATQILMAVIDNLDQIYYCPLKSNRLVDDTGGVKKISKSGNIKLDSRGIIIGKNYKNQGFS